MRILFCIALFLLVFPAGAFSQWEKVGYPGGAVVIYPYDSVWIGTLYKDIYISTDDGDSWKIITDNLPVSSILTMYRSYYQDDTIFVRLRDSRNPDYPRYVDSVLFWRTLNDKEWSTTQNIITFPSEYIKYLSKDTLIYVGEPLPGTSDTSEFYVSFDGGTKWEQRISGLPHMGTNLYNYKYINGRCFIQVSFDSTVLQDSIVTSMDFDAGYYYSDDLGKSWKKLVPYLNRGGFEYLNQGNGTLFITTVSSGTDSSSIERSTDNGSTWSSAKQGIDLKQITNIVNFKDFGHVMFATFHVVDFPLDTTHHYVSYDRGKSWTKKPDLTNLGIFWMIAYRNHKRDGYLVQKQINDVYLLDSNFSLKGQYTYPGLLEGSQTIVYAADSILVALTPYSLDSVVFSVDDGDSWQKAPPFSTQPLESSIWQKGEKYIFRSDNNNSAGYCYDCYQSFFRSNNNGQTWNQMKLPLSNNAARYKLINIKDTIFLCYVYPDSLIGECYISDVGGETWSQVNTPFPSYRNIDNIISQRNEVIVCTENFKEFSSTEDFGKTWDYKEIPITQYDNIYTFSTDGSRRYLLGLKGGGYSLRPLIVSCEKGSDVWNELETNLPDYAAPLNIVKYGSMLFLLSTSNMERSNHDGAARLYRSIDNGKTWMQIGQQLPTGYQMYFTDKYIFISGYQCLYRYPLALAGIHDSKPNSNNSLSVSAYPNPTTKELTISHTSGRAERVVMYDMTGTLVKSGTVSGEATWDVSALPSVSYMLGIPGGKMHVVQVVK
jgi:hypothetical protein